MLYLRSFNRFILISLVLMGLSVSSANAAVVQFDFNETITTTNIAVLSVGQSAKIAI